MLSTRTFAYLALAVGVLYIRNWPVIKNIIIPEKGFIAGYVAGGSFKTDCAPLTQGKEGLKFCEDAAFWDINDSKTQSVSRRVIISCDPGRKSWNTVMGPLRDPEPHGALWLYTPTSDSVQDIRSGGKAQRIEFKGYPPNHDFHPLGLEVTESEGGETSDLYVVNHARQRSFIEHFKISPGSPTIAKHVRTISSPFFIAPNALALTSSRSFYLTNDHLLTRRLPIFGHVLPLVESLLGLPLSFVTHVTLNDPSKSPAVNAQSPAALFVPFANGIAISPDGKSAVIASSSLATIFMFQRDPSTNALTKAGKISVPCSPDNLRYTDAGNLIVGCHPNFPQLIKVSAGQNVVAPSWVLEIKRRTGNVVGTEDAQSPVPVVSKVPVHPQWMVETLFQSNGTGFQTATAGLKDDRSGHLFIPGLYAEEGMIVCRSV